MDIEKRKQEILKCLIDTIGLYAYELTIDKIVKQEIELIDQEKKAAILKFAKKVKDEFYMHELGFKKEKVIIEFISELLNNLLTQYGIDEKI